MSQIDPLLEVYLYENTQLLEQLEEMFLNGEENHSLSHDNINEVFRIMHTIKGSSSMMSFDDLAKLAHKLEDLFSSIRETMPPKEEWAEIFDIVLEAVDYFKIQMENIQEGNSISGDTSKLISRIEKMHSKLKNGEVGASKSSSTEVLSANDGGEKKDDEKYYKVHISFEEACGMETIRAFGVVNSLNGMYSSMNYLPSNIDQNCDEIISENGFSMFFISGENEDVLRAKLEETILLRSIEFSIIEKDEYLELTGQKQPVQKEEKDKQDKNNSTATASKSPVQQSFISVNVDKIDKLMNLMGEIVTTESMVIKNPDLANMHLENFDKQARLLRKLTDELQDVVMSIRMVPISSTFHKMKRIVRDMSKKIEKEANLILIGEKTEVDKNVIDCLSDPLMHLIRNSMDHGLETPADRIAKGKPAEGTITLEAKNTGGDVIVCVSDDGKGLDKDKLIAKAIKNGLTTKNENEISDKEAYQFIMMPGFSTKEKVTEFSGRGVGMDVVKQNIESIGGTISIESELGKGMSIIMHIPLTLAIIEGMNVTVGDSKLIIPILNIRESLEAKTQEIIVDPDGNEMVIIRGECFKIIKLYERFGIETPIQDVKDGILVLVESESGASCVLVDKLLGEQQAVIKPMPAYITKLIGKPKGVGGCSILGDGNISLIIDINSLLA